MRKLVTVFCFTLIISVIGCSNVLDNEQDSDVFDPNLSKVIISLPNASNTARAVGLEDTKTHTNYFEAFFRRTDIEPNVFYSADAMLSDGKIEIIVYPGTYDILLFAGNNSSSFSSPILLASSHLSNKNIILGQINQINMELATFDKDFIAPEYCIVGESFTVDVEINANNPLIELPINLFNLYLSPTNVYPGSESLII